jgi:hypothetical protein
VLASEIYSIIKGVDIAIVINTTIKIITKQLGFSQTLIIVCTDLYLLYKCLVKLGSTQEKRLIIDIIALWQSYERREITEIQWINEKDNPADVITKSTLNKALKKLINTNQLGVQVKE